MENKNYDELLKQSLLTIRTLKQKLEGAKTSEKIAVVGMACRFPGGSDTPEKFWQFLCEGRTGITDVPENRYDIADYYDPVHGKPGKMYVRKENFLQQDIAEFDAKLFGISNIEANEMDPHQRLLCEVSWEAIENTGLNLQNLRGSRTGIFLGISSSGEYSKIPRDPAKVNQYTGTGTISCIAAGRLSYLFGWNGPSVSLDTACSSSLVGTHLAVNALANGECDLAVSLGVSLMISPEVMSSLCAMNALAEDGQSKPFDAAADGYGRGEGCGAVVLKRLSDAVNDHDTIYAVITGSAVNNDGESSSLTVPNGKAQKQVMQAALSSAGISPDEIDYLETHGTGTLLGDPVEFDAIREVFLTETNKRHSDLKIGAVKGNIGHLEAAAGVAGLIKVILCLYHRKLAPIANFNQLNPRIKCEQLPVEFITKSQDWTAGSGRLLMAGISSFGFSGTNAHMVLSEGPKVPDSDAAMPGYLLCLSAKTEKGVVTLALKYRQLLTENQECDLSAICYMANSSRQMFAHCVVLYGQNKQDFLTGVEKIIVRFQRNETIYLTQAQLTGSSEGEDRLDAKRNIFKPLDESTFTAVVDKMIQPKLAFVFHAQGEMILRPAQELYHILPLFRHKLDPYLEEINRQGIKEDFQFCTAGEGTATALFALAAHVALAEMLVDIGINAEVVCGQESGDFAAAVMAKIMSFAAAAECMIDHYAGGGGMKPSSSELRRPASRYICMSSGEMLREVPKLHIHFSQEVYQDKGMYDQTIKELYRQGYRLFVEFGENKHRVSDILDHNDVVGAGMFYGGGAFQELLLLLARCITLGSNVKWLRFFEGMSIKKTVIPNYPFEKTRHWVALPPQNQSSFYGVPRFSDKFNAQAIWLPFDSKQYRFVYNNANFHEVRDNSGIIHVGYYLEMLQNVLHKEYPHQGYRIENMDFMSALMLLEEETKEVLIVLDKEDDALHFSIFNKNPDQKDWIKNMKGQISLIAAGDEKISNHDEAPASFAEPELEAALFYEELEKKKGLYFGHAVRWVEKVLITGDTAYVQFRHSDDDDAIMQYNLGIHPGILDSCAQVCNYMAMNAAPKEKKYMVKRMEQVRINPQFHINDTLSAQVIFKGFDKDREEIMATVRVFNENGEVIIEIGSIVLKEFSEKQLGVIKAMMEGTRSGAGQDSQFLRQLKQVPLEQKKALLCQYVVAVMAAVLDEKPEDIDITEPMENFGLDSMSGLDFYNRITEQLGVEMPFSQLAQCKNLTVSAEKILNKLQGDTEVITEVNTEDDVAEENLSPELWIYDYTENRNVKARIFCFPNGFRSADMFASWQKQLGNDIQVCAIKIPGMDMSRITEKAPAYVDEFIKKLITVLDHNELLDAPCASFGHSWGSLFSYQLGYYLEQHIGNKYFKLFVSGYTSPAIKNSSIVKILDDIKNQGFYNIPLYEEIKNNREAVDLLVNSFIKEWGYEEKGTRAVLNLLLSATGLIDRYVFNPQEKLAAPIVGFHGVDDYVVSIDEMNSWEILTTSGFKLWTMKGDHQFVNENQSEQQLLETIKAEIMSCA